MAPVDIDTESSLNDEPLIQRQKAVTAAATPKGPRSSSRANEKEGRSEMISPSLQKFVKEAQDELNQVDRLTKPRQV